MPYLRIALLPVTFILSAILVWFFVKPLYDETRVLNQIKRPELETSVQRENDLQERTAKIFGDTENGGDGIAILKALPDNSETKNLIAQLEFMINKERMSLVNISINDGSSAQQTAVSVLDQNNGKAYREISGSFDVKGGYGQFKQLLRDIRKLDRLVNVKEISIINTSNEEGGVTGRYTIGFNTYWQPTVTEEQVRTGLENIGSPPGARPNP